MNLESVFSSEIFHWIIIPLLIFSARVMDVSLGTMRIVFVSRGLKYFAPLVGFFEVIIWLLAIRGIMQNLDNIACYIAYGAGFATGTFIGLFIEKRLALGNLIIRLITNKDSTELISHLKDRGYGVTSAEAQGVRGKVHVIFLIIKRHDLPDVTKTIREYNPNAFYTVEDINMVKKGVFPAKKTRPPHMFPLKSLRFWRTGK